MKQVLLIISILLVLTLNTTSLFLMLSIVNLDEVIIARIVFGELFLILLNVFIIKLFSVGLCEELKVLWEDGE